MAFPGDVNSLGSVSGSQTLAAAGHATRHNEVKTALEGIRDALGGTAVPSGTVQPILAAGSASAPSLSFTGDSNTGLWSPGADTVAFSTGGGERLRIGSTGNVGIGTSSPSVAFHVSGQALVSANASGNAFEIRQTGAGNALVVEDSTNPDSTPFVINADGRVIVGSTTSIAGSSGTQGVLQVHGSVTGITSTIANWSTGGNDAARLDLVKSKSGTVGTRAAVADNDDLGLIRFSGDDGTSFIAGAAILGEVDGTPGTNDMPGRLVFSTTADGSATPTERMRIDSSGNVGIGTNAPAHHLEVSSGTSFTPRIGITNTNTDASPGYLVFEKDPSDNLISTNDGLGTIRWRAPNTGGSQIDAAEIRVEADAPNTATSTAGRMGFYTTPNNGTTTERMRIDNAGLITGSGTSLGAWTAYTPTLGGTGWAIGNGTAEGKYCQMGKIVHFWLRITLGSTSTAGAGACTVTVPVAPTDGNRFALKGSLWDASASQRYAAQCDQSSGSEFAVRYISSAAGLFAAVTTTAPFTWTTSDFIQIDGTYSA